MMRCGKRGRLKACCACVRMERHEWATHHRPTIDLDQDAYVFGSVRTVCFLCVCFTHGLGQFFLVLTERTSFC